MKATSLLVLTFLVLNICFGQVPWHSSLVYPGEDEKLVYQPDEYGFIIPDFSHAGYKGGGIDIPHLPSVKEISAIEGDNTSHIQAAINEVGLMPMDQNGFRGALLLKAGRYEIFGTLYVKYSGVVLRGEGEGDNPENSTIIYARGNTPHQRDVIIMGSTSKIYGTSQVPGSKSMILDEIVAAGSKSFLVENSYLYKEGDRIMIYHPATQAWIDAVDKGGVPYPDPYAPANPDERWVENQLPIVFHRFITRISGDTINIDAPVFYTLNKQLSPSFIYKPIVTGLINQVGLENLRVEIETTGGTDENHAWQAVRFKSCENSWAKNCTFSHFGQSGIITEGCSRSTFANCSAIDPVAKITGERMYNFNTYHFSQLNLFVNCYARNGRHHYVSNGTSTTSGNVFLRCTSDATNSVNEGHRQWTQGMLYDNHKEINLKRDFVLGLYNRVAMGTGHGWSAVHSVLWNCDVDRTYGKIGLQKPPTAQNYAIGCFAKSITNNPISASNFPIGFVEGHNTSGLLPVSLYEAQLADRLSLNTSIAAREIHAFDMYPTLVDQKLSIQFNQSVSGKKVIRIISLEGRLINIMQTSNSRIEITQLPETPGIYIIECRTENATICKKFIKM